MRFAAGSQLAQTRPEGTTAITAFTAVTKTEVTQIIVTNVTATDATFSIYHDDDGSTYSDDTVLWDTVTVSARSTVTIKAEGGPGTGLMMLPDGTIGVETGTADAVNFTLYGVTEDVAPAMGLYR